MVQVAAVSFCIVCLLAIAFQLALICGAPWGACTLGGRWQGRLPPRVRILPLISVVLLAAFSAIVAARAGLVLPAARPSAAWAWVVVGYCALGCVANAATPSRRERAIWLPVVLLMLALSTTVAVG